MISPVRVLLVQKSASEADQIVAAFRQGGFAPTCRLVTTREEYHTVLSAETWDLIVSDYAVAEFNAFFVLETISTLGLFLPVIIVAEAIGEERVAALFEAGAAGFVLRGNWPRLLAVIDLVPKNAAARAESKKVRDGRLTAHISMERELQKRHQELHKLNTLLREEVIERRRAEEAQLAISRHLRLTLRTSKAGSWDWDLKTDVMTYSDEMRALFGMKPGQPVGTFDQRLQPILPEDQDLVSAAVEQARQVGVLDVEFRIRRQDTGETRWLCSRGQVSFDDTKDPAHMLGITFDLTERKILEQQLKEANQRLETHLANSPLAVIEFDGRFTLIRWSSEAEHMFGWSAAEVIGKKVSDFKWVHEEDRERISQLSVQMTSGVKPRNMITNRNYRKDGSVIDCEWYSSAIFDTDGRLVSVLSQVLDVTERLRGQEALRESEERFRIMADGLPLIIWVHGPDGRHQFVNKTYLEFFGFTGENLQTDQWSLLVHPDDSESYTGEFLRCVQERRSFHAEARVRHSSGEWRWIESWGRPRFSPSGEFLGFVGTSADINERKRAEESLQRTARRNQLVAHAVGELLESSDPRQLVTDLCYEVMQYLDCQVFFNYLIHPVSGKLYLNSWAGISDEEAKRIEWLDPGTAMCACIDSQRQRATGGHILTLQDMCTGTAAKFGMKACACHSLMNPNGEVVGTVSFGTSNRETFSDDDLSLMKAVVDHVAVALVRMLTEEALRRSEQRFRIFVDQSLDGVIIIDNQGRILQWSPGEELMTGIPQSEALGQLLWDVQYRLVPPERKTPDLLQRKKDKILDGLREGANLRRTIEEEIQRPDGARRTIQSVVFAIPVGEEILAGGIGRDITEHKRADEALRESEARYSKLIRYAPAGIYEIDFRTRRFTSVNDVVCQLTGYSREELLTMQASDILDETGKMLFQQRIDRWLAGEKPDENVEYRVKAKDGREIYVVLNATFTTDDQGRPFGATVIGFDVTERKRMEAELLNTAEKYSSIINTASDGIWIQDLDGYILEVNDAYCRLSGYSSEELLGSHISSIEAAESPDEIKAHIQKVVASNGHDQFESRHRRKDGSVWHVDITALYLGREGGRIAVFARDISERKRAEAAVSENQQRLRAALASTELNVCEQDTALRYTWAYDSCFGSAGHEIMGRTDFDLFEPEQAERLTEIKRRVLNTGTAAREKIYLTHAGRSGWFDLTVEVCRDRSGEIAGITSVSMPLTSRSKEGVGMGQEDALS